LKEIPTCASVVSSAVCTYGSGTPSDLANNNYCKTEDNGTLKLYKSDSTASTVKCIEITTLVIIKDTSGVIEDATVGTDSGQIFSCSSTGCVQYKSNYHIFNTETKLYGCTDTGTCSDQTIAEGYYLSGPPTVSGGVTTFSSLIKCTGTTFNTCSTSSITVGFFVDANDKLIQCTTTSSCQYMANAGTNETKYYIDAVTAGNLITCTSVSCTSAKAIEGYYINAGESGTIIKCTGSACTKATIETSCSKAGPIMTGLKLCIGGTESKTISATAAATTTYQYLTLNLAAATDFPGDSQGKITVRLGSEGSAILLKDGGLPACTANSGTTCFTGATANQFCIYTDNKIYKQDSSCAVENISGIKYFKNDYTEATIASDDALTAYQCESSGTCQVVKGYVVETNTIVQCSGWKGVSCVKTADSSLTACAANDNGKMGTGKKLCFSDSESVSLPASGTTEYLAFELTKTSELYGKNEGDVVVLSLSDTQAIVTSLSGSKLIFFMLTIYIFFLILIFSFFSINIKKKIYGKITEL